MKLKNEFLGALLKEIALRKDYLGNGPVNTVYFGGGTPSLLTQDELKRIIDAIFDNFRIAEGAEFTLEANPDDIDAEKLALWKLNHINRLSIGVQSFFREDLQWMNRAHDEEQALRCIHLARQAGFNNMSIDLIYGAPTLSDDKWISNLETATSLSIPHLSCYALTVEPKTALESMISRKKVAPVNAEDQARQFLIMTDMLASKGYEHYEISNFALPGMRSRHNSSYWSGESYVGLGPSAHSFNGKVRQWNVANNALYIEALKRNQVPYEDETLTTVQRFNEYIMTSLRTIEGTDVLYTEQQFGKAYADELINGSLKFIERGWLESRNDRLVLTKEGKLFADGIASELFSV